MVKLNTLFIFVVVINLAFSSELTKTEPTPSSYKGKAILASALAPGWGQITLKNNLKGEIMLWTDGALWLFYGGYSWYGNSRNHDAKNFASIYADANTKIKNDEYFRALERYNSSDVYNEDIRREARERFPDDPAAQNSYLLQNGYFGDSAWIWQTDSFRFTYWNKRKSARSAFTKAGFLLGGALLNRLVSMIDCAFFTPDKRNKIGFVPNFDEPGIGLIYRF
jgi:hypothetical protein